MKTLLQILQVGNKYKLLFSVFSVFCIGYSLSAQPLHGVWAVGGKSVDKGFSIVQAPDSSYFVIGQTNTYGAGLDDVYAAKLNKAGVLMGAKTYGGKAMEAGYSVCKTPKGYAIAGFTNGFGAGKSDFYVIMTDLSGSTQWIRTVGGIADEMAYSIEYSSDDYLIITGFTNTFGAGDYDMYIVKLDMTGAIKWTRTVGGERYEVGNSVKQTSDRGYIIVGTTTSYGAGNEDVYVVKLDNFGNLLWTKTIGGQGRDVGMSVYQTAKDDGYIITGSTDSFGAGKRDVYVIRLDSGGALLWAKTIGGESDDEGISVIQSDDGGYAIAGYTMSYGVGSEDVYFIKLDTNGNLLWANTLGGKLKERGQSIKQTADKGYVIGGHTESFGFGAQDVFVVKYDLNGRTCYDQLKGGVEKKGGTVKEGGLVKEGGKTGEGGIELKGGERLDICTTSTVNPTYSSASISISPNPASEYVLVKSDRVVEQISIFNATGSRLHVARNASNEARIDIRNLSNGIYLVQLSTEYGITNKKLIVER